MSLKRKRSTNPKMIGYQLSSPSPVLDSNRGREFRFISPSVYRIHKVQELDY